MHTSSSSGGCGGLHSGVRVCSPASTSAVPWRYPPPQRQPHSLRHSPYHQQQHPPLLLQQQQHAPAAAPGDKASDSTSSSSSSGSQAFRFKHLYNPQAASHMPQGSWSGWPLEDGTRVAVAGEQTRLRPEQELWPAEKPLGAADLRNPWASRFRVARVPPPVPPSLPGSEYWHVEALQDYSRAWPSLKWADGRLQFRKGFLEPFDDPKTPPRVVPFFFYRGLEQLTYSWGDRAFQALFTAVYAGVHVALFSWCWSSNPPLALAVALNWGLGRLSLAKWGILLFLACNDRLWLYFLYLAGKLVDRALARLFPPIREFCWAMFTLWLLFVAVTPAYYYPLPCWPFAPGTLGPQEAIA